MALYKPGDSVMIREDLRRDTEYYTPTSHIAVYVNDDMYDRRGMVYTIESVGKNEIYRLAGDVFRWAWVDDMFVDRCALLDDLCIESDCDPCALLI